MAVNACALCSNATARATQIGDLAVDEIECPRCGRYRIARSLKDQFTAMPDRTGLVSVAAHTRQTSARGETVELTSDNWQSLADGHRHTTVDRKLDMVLRHLADRSSRPGFKVPIETDDWLLFDAKEPTEMPYLVEALTEQGLVQPKEGFRFIVTPAGWQRLAPSHPGGEPNTCFVAMAFHPSLDAAYEHGIKPAIEASGLKPIQLSKLQHNQIVDDVMLAAIRRGRLTVADVTLQRHGVYFEAGFALGLGRPVIWACRQDDFANVHFDTRQYNYIVWTDPEDLRARLTVRIQATVIV
jgi:hypothetical protein